MNSASFRQAVKRISSLTYPARNHPKTALSKSAYSLIF
nr:MAG TPA: hypothetical protein [Caudoviricetes sp.]